MAACRLSDTMKKLLDVFFVAGSILQIESVIYCLFLKDAVSYSKIKEVVQSE
jgi:hypothetical protein